MGPIQGPVPLTMVVGLWGRDMLQVMGERRKKLIYTETTQQRQRYREPKALESVVPQALF